VNNTEIKKGSIVK